MSEPYVAQIQIFGFNFAPRNYAFCNGQQVAISQNQALFSIIGTTYGGNGVTTFALPNIQDQTIMNWGQGPGLTNYALGQQSGVAEVTLNQSQIPQHAHNPVQGYAPDNKADFFLSPSQNGWIGARAVTPSLFATAPTPGASFAAQVISTTGGQQPHQNEQPYLCMNFCIALYGIFPSRN